MKNTFAMVLVAASISGSAAVAAPTDLKATAYTLLQKLASSGYGTRSLCIFGKEVVGIQPGPHWSKPSFQATGTIDNFPKKLAQTTKPSFTMEYPSGPNDWGRFEVYKQSGSTEFIITTGKKGLVKADICMFESKPVLESF